MGFDYLRPHEKKLARTFLIQRLDEPSKGTGPFGLDNPFAFGGGLKNGGLSDDAMNLLREHFSFDYMGAAEFEFGSVPAALTRMAAHADKNNLVAHQFEFDKSKMEKGWRKEAVQPSGTATIYVLCHKDHISQVEELINKLARETYNRDLKESTRLYDVLHPVGDYVPRTRGWLELNNGFMFFISKGMFEGVAGIFGVKTEVDAK